MNRRSKNAQSIAEALHGYPKIERVIYPSLSNEADQEAIYKAQFDFPGGMFSIVLKAGKAAAFDFLRHITIGAMPSLSAVSRRWPANSTTDSDFTQEELAATGMVRISADIEDWRDLLTNSEQALG